MQEAVPNAKEGEGRNEMKRGCENTLKFVIFGGSRLNKYYLANFGIKEHGIEYVCKTSGQIVYSVRPR